jgi:carbamoyltransferase
MQPTPTTIIGINVSHNASAALMIEGQIVLAVQEERFTGKKNFMGYPKQSVDYILNYLKERQLQPQKIAFATLKQVSYWYEHPVQHYFDMTDFHNFYGVRYYGPRLQGQPVDDYYISIENRAHQNKWDGYLPFEQIQSREDKLNNHEKFGKMLCDFAAQQTSVSIENIHFFDHHTCHAFYAYFAAKRQTDDALVVTLDSDGDQTNQTIWDFTSQNRTLLSRTNTCDLARIYKITTLLLGMKPDEHEYKVMGMAPYAKHEYVEKAYNAIYADLLQVKDGLVLHKNRPKDMYAYLERAFKPFRFDNISGAVQMLVEKTVIEIFTQLHEQTGKRHFCLSGGVAMNIKMNMVLSQLPFVDQLYVPPSGADESLCMGVCYVMQDALNQTSQPLKNAYLGKDVNEGLTEEKLRSLFPSANYDIQKNVSHAEVAQLLANNKVVACVRNREEFGARALGNRSILSSPKEEANKFEINEAIKNRDFWMPFALSILKERQADFLVNPKNISASYMTIGFDTRPEKYPLIKAGTHPYDKTCRPQMVDASEAPEYHSLISAFEKLTGIPALLNTSLNLHGNPICSTIESVAHTMHESGLGYLYLNDNYLIIKK